MYRDSWWTYQNNIRNIVARYIPVARLSFSNSSMRRVGEYLIIRIIHDSYAKISHHIPFNTTCTSCSISSEAYVYRIKTLMVLVNFSAGSRPKLTTYSQHEFLDPNSIGSRDWCCENVVNSSAVDYFQHQRCSNTSIHIMDSQLD